MSAVLDRRFSLRPHLARITAGAIVLGLYGLSRVPVLAPTEQSKLASAYKFTEMPLPEVSGPAHQFSRPVNPSLQGISAWISISGAAVALADLDRDGLANDVCYVETRTNQVVVGPVPGTAQRYQPFALDLPRAETTAPMGCLPTDFNEDGKPDLLVYFFGRTPLLLVNQGGNGLAANHYRSQPLVKQDEPWYTIATTTADFDGDGHVDLMIGNYFADGLPLLGAHHPAFNPKDGWMHESFSRGAPTGGKQRIFLWQRGKDGQFAYQEAKGVFDQVDAGRSWSLAAAAADLDGDLLPELYIANDFGPDFLLHNDSTPGKLHFTRLHGQKNFTTPNSKVLGNDSFKGMGAEFGDLNGDGILDILVSNITVNYAFQESNFAFIGSGNKQQMAAGIAPFSDRSEPLNLSRTGGWNWEVRLGDFNNDATPEVLYAVGFIQGTVNRWPEVQELAHVNDGLTSNPRLWPQLREGDAVSNDQADPFFALGTDGKYHDIAADLGLGRPRISRGIATADVDGDGLLDYAIADQWANSYFYRNQSPTPGKFLGLHILLPTKNASLMERSGHPGPDTLGRPAIGAEVTVHLPDGRRLVSQIDGGNGHSGKRSPELHFGLGWISANQRLLVDLRWRDAEGQVQNTQLHLTPGWHTVLAGNTPAEK